MPNKVTSNRLKGVSQDRQVVDDEQILNIQIKKQKKNTNSEGEHMVSVSHQNFDKLANKTQNFGNINLQSTKVVERAGKRKTKNKSPNQPLYNSGQFIFNDINKHKL